MKAAPFRYHAPRTLDEALGLLADSPNARVLAGGQSLMPMLNMRVVSPDDLVDIMSESSQSGKTPGTDLREGVPTLAALIALGGQSVRDVRLRELLSRPLDDDNEHAEALRLLRSHPALAEARQEACRWADEARAALAPLPSGGASRTLELLCDYVVSRTG